MPVRRAGRPPAEILALFDAERREDRLPEPGVRYERAGPVIRAIGAWNAVVSADLAAENADAFIAEQVAFFRSQSPGRGDAGAADHPSVARQTGVIEWKVYGYDLPPDLGSRLAAAGFEPDETETLVIFDLADDLREDPHPAAAGATAVEVRRVTDMAGVAEAAETARIAFRRDEHWQAARTQQYQQRLTDPTLGLYVAYVDGRPVASARAEFPAQRSFVGLWGGGTIPEYRGRGIYRALVRARADDARRRGYPYLRVDARETSRPILERLGFLPLTSIVEWRFLLPAGPRVANACR
ncbi:MAG TPA: GNAT family N-acetyltransferase [bacterium]|nr:GNAT family N-acetyltransferase [bacterium]